MSFFCWLAVFAEIVAVCFPVSDGDDSATCAVAECTRSVAVVVFVPPSSAMVAGNVLPFAGVMRTASVTLIPLILTPIAMADLLVARRAAAIFRERCPQTGRCSEFGLSPARREIAA